MTMQYPCESCSDGWPLEKLLMVALTGSLMCPACTNKLINDLSNKLSGKEIVSILQDY